jgi:amidase
MTSTVRLSATETITLVRQGKLTVSQCLEDYLSRYDERNPVVKAWAFLDKARARKEALRLDQLAPEQRGPLHGVIVGIKDMMCRCLLVLTLTTDTKDMPTQHGSPIYKDQFAAFDAEPVAVLRALGALILGKTASSANGIWRRILIISILQNSPRSQ